MEKKICDDCGEYRKVKKIIYNAYDMGGIGNHRGTIFGISFASNITYDYICEDCQQAKDIINRECIDKIDIEKKIRKKEWVKRRNKILKNESTAYKTKSQRNN